ncbi:hypothetical protein [Sinomonas sp. RB5]
MQSLTDLDTGRWLVTTGSGTTHQFDIRADGSSTVTRLPRQVGPATDLDISADLRRDGEVLGLIGILLLRVGVEGAFYLRVRTDGVATLRMTTPIQSIRRLEES